MLRTLCRILTMALLVSFLPACPHARRGIAPPVGQEVPAVLWTVQLEDEPWPHGIVSDALLVMSMRTSEAGFSYPIQLNALAPADGKLLWNTPTRPWLLDRDVPWSFALDWRAPVLGIWEKGDVLRTLRMEDGQDAWSLPECRGVVAMQSGLVTAARGALWLLEPKDGRTLKRQKLPASPLLPPVRIKDLAVLVLGDGRVVAMDPGTGQIRWERTLRGAPPGKPGLLLSWDGGALVAISEPTNQGSSGRVLALDGVSGAPLWEAPLPIQKRPGSPSGLARLRIQGDLLLWPEPKGDCMRALELATGKVRFRTCGLNLRSPAVRFENSIYALGVDDTSAKALRRGAPWYAVDFPVVVINATTGKASPLLRRDVQRASPPRRGRPTDDSQGSSRATRLPLARVTDGVIYLLERNRFLTALRVGYSPVSDPIP